MKPSPADTHVADYGAGIAGLAAAMILAEAARSHIVRSCVRSWGKAKSYVFADGQFDRAVCVGLHRYLPNSC